MSQVSFFTERKTIKNKYRKLTPGCVNMVLKYTWLNGGLKQHNPFGLSSFGLGFSKQKKEIQPTRNELPLFIFPTRIYM